MNKTTYLFCIFLLIGCSRYTDNPDTPASSAGTLDPETGKAFVCFRIGVPLWASEKRCTELFDLFDKYKGVTDEITFFTSGTHAPLPPDTIKERASVLKQRMEQARKRGYKAGINILTTIGHHEENLDNSLKGDYTQMTDIEGAVCHGSFCPNDERMREYIASIYQLTARANPDYIWIDDDVRFHHMPIGKSCFCDNCLNIFEKETGVKYSRKSLKKAMGEGSAENKMQVREAWLQHNRNTISRLFELIEKTVHDINPLISLGYMTGDHFFDGYDFENWAKILSGPNKVPVMWRPGGGYYDDRYNGGIAFKANEIGRQVSALPQDVVSIQSEIECFPYQRLKKAANIVVLEACSYIAAGSTGAAFNVLSMYDEPLDEYEPLMFRLQESRPFFDLMARSLGRLPNTGVYAFWNKNSYVTVGLHEGNWLSPGSPVVNHDAYSIGLPACYSDKNAQITLLGKDNIFALSKDEIEKLLSRGVYLDAETLQQLNAKGFGELTGFEVVDSKTADRIEKFTTHPLNGAFAGRERDNRQSFWPSPAYTLRSTNNQAQVLTGLIDYTGKEISPCTMGIFENKLGGRICVSGYYPWTFMENLSKSSQMKAVFRWLSKDNLPGYIASYHKINLWIREPQNGKIALAFSNSSFDPAKEVVLMLRTANKTIRVYDMKCGEAVIHSSGTDGPYRKFVIPEVDPWQLRLVICQQ